MYSDVRTATQQGSDGRTHNDGKGEKRRVKVKKKDKDECMIEGWQIYSEGGAPQSD